MDPLHARAHTKRLFALAAVVLVFAAAAGGGVWLLQQPVGQPERAEPPNTSWANHPPAATQLDRSDSFDATLQVGLGGNAVNDGTLQPAKVLPRPSDYMAFLVELSSSLLQQMCAVAPVLVIPAAAEAYLSESEIDEIRSDWLAVVALDLDVVARIGSYIEAAETLHSLFAAEVYCVHSTDELLAIFVDVVRAFTDPVLCTALTDRLVSVGFSMDWAAAQVVAASVKSSDTSVEFSAGLAAGLEFPEPFALAARDLLAIKALYQRSNRSIDYSPTVYRYDLLPAHVHAIADAAMGETQITTLPLLLDLYLALVLPGASVRPGMRDAMVILLPVIEAAISRLGGTVPPPLEILAHGLDSRDPAVVASTAAHFGTWAGEQDRIMPDVLRVGEGILAMLDPVAGRHAASGYGSSAGAAWRMGLNVGRPTLLDDLGIVIARHRETADPLVKLFCAGLIGNMAGPIKDPRAYEMVRDLLFDEYPGPFTDLPHSPPQTDWTVHWAGKLVFPLASKDRVRAYADTIELAKHDADPIAPSAISALCYGCRLGNRLRPDAVEPTREWLRIMIDNPHALRFDSTIWIELMRMAKESRAFELIEVLEPIVPNLEYQWAREALSDELELLRALRSE